MLWNLFALVGGRQPRPGSANRSYRPVVEALETRETPATLPAGFGETVVASGLTNASAMELAPDGKLFITEQAGTMEVWQNGSRLRANFFQNTPLAVNSDGERGLLGVAFDPNYATNRFVYVYYTTAASVHSRVSRFTANATGDLALAGSEFFVLDVPTGAGTNHLGGAIHFGPDGKLYIAIGDNGTSSNAQNLGNLHGKILRLNADGTIPSDNPFLGSTMGLNQAIWAVGLRNPFTFSFQPGTGRMFINDVGSGSGAPSQDGNPWEEINDGIAGGNYDWPNTEGPFTGRPGFVQPFFAYNHTAFAAITGGAFYNPATNQFPSQYAGDYFFADLGFGWIRHIDLSTRQVADFATGISLPVDLKVGADGSLFYLTRGDEQVVRVQFLGNVPPQAFFRDAENRLGFVDANGARLNTGAFATTLSVGVNAAASAEAYFLDGNNRLYRYDQGQTAFTGAFATAIFAGQEQVFFLDGENRLYVYEDGIGSRFLGAWATRVSLGRDATGADELWFTDGANRLYRYRQGQFTFTGALATALEAGRQGQVAFLDGASRLYISHDVNGFTQTNFLVSQMSFGLDAAGNDLLFFRDTANRLFRFQNGAGTFTGAFTIGLEAARNGQVAFLDGNRMLYLMRANGTFLMTSFAASRASANLDSSDAAVYFTSLDNELHRLRSELVTPLEFIAIDLDAF